MSDAPRPVPADRPDPADEGPKFPTLADAEEWMSHSAGRWVPQGIGDLYRLEYDRRGNELRTLRGELRCANHTIAELDEAIQEDAARYDRQAAELARARRWEAIGRRLAEHLTYRGHAGWEAYREHLENELVRELNRKD